MFTHHFGRPKHSRREPCSVREARKWRPALSGDMTCLSGKSLIADSTMSRETLYHVSLLCQRASE